MSIDIGNAGIDCLNCGYIKEVTKEQDLEFRKELSWSSTGSPFCPECGHQVMYEDYTDCEQ